MHESLENSPAHPELLCTEQSTFLLTNLPTLQELRTWEEELTRAALQQKNQEELLRRREQELAEREIDILERELNIIIHQLCQEKPRVKKRKGKFRKNRLKLRDGNRISLPSGQWPWVKWEKARSSYGAGFVGAAAQLGDTRLEVSSGSVGMGHCMLWKDWFANNYPIQNCRVRMNVDMR